MTKSTLLKFWAAISIVWLIYVGHACLKVMQAFKLSLSDYKLNDVMFHFVPLFISPPVILAAILWILWRVVLWNKGRD